MNEIIPIESIEKLIYLVRGQKVILDEDLADLYQVETRRINEQVKRNSDRFPEDFMFRLTQEEFKILKSQFATSRWGGRRKLPYAFTEQGVAMLSSVLNSSRAIKVNIQIMRTFVNLRRMLMKHKDLAQRLNELERKYDGQFKVVFEAIRQLMQPKQKPKRKIGFQANDNK